MVSRVLLVVLVVVASAACDAQNNPKKRTVTRHFEGHQVCTTQVVDGAPQASWQPVEILREGVPSADLTFAWPHKWGVRSKVQAHGVWVEMKGHWDERFVRIVGDKEIPGAEFELDLTSGCLTDIANGAGNFTDQKKTAFTCAPEVCGALEGLRTGRSESVRVAGSHPKNPWEPQVLTAVLDEKKGREAAAPTSDGGGVPDLGPTPRPEP